MAKPSSSQTVRLPLRMEHTPATPFIASNQPNEIAPSLTTRLRFKAVSVTTSPRLLEKRLRRGRRLF